ncbi:metal ABC transporter permease [Clostridiales bacterium COT073_COT-073]|nr:metal ABC transporter permease [Clostridiales bacterium COT073_COT-073]
MIEALFKYTFLQNAFLTAVFASIVCGIVGTIIVEKKLVSFSGGIAHVSFGGIGLGYFLKFEPIFGGIAFAILAALGVAQIRKRSNTNEDTLISMLWAAGMALGILFIALTPGYPPDMTSYLFGDILTVNALYLRVMIGLSAAVLLIVTLLYSYWKMYLFDEEYAGIIGIRTSTLEFILYLMIAVSIVILIKVVGIILSIAMLTAPPAIVKLFTNRLSRVMIGAGILGIMFNLAGLTISYQMNIPSGATIILLAISAYLLAFLGKKAMITLLNHKVTK